MSALYQEEATLSSATGCDTSGLLSSQMPESSCSSTIDYRSLASFDAFYEMCGTGNLHLIANYQIQCRLHSNGSLRIWSVKNAPICSASESICNPGDVASFYFDYVDKLDNADCTYTLDSAAWTTVTSAPTASPMMADEEALEMWMNRQQDRQNDSRDELRDRLRSSFNFNWDFFLESLADERNNGN